jgi:feruloyl esterase
VEGFRLPRHAPHDGRRQAGAEGILRQGCAVFVYAQYSYFNGSSTGGQQAMQEAQRYPDDYDGIVGGLPAHCRTPLHAYFLWNDQILNKCRFTPSQQDNIIAAGNEYMAAKEMPAIAGKFVSDPRCDSKDIEAVIALAMKKDSTLTKEQADGLRKLFDGPRHAVTGERIFDGIPFGSSFNIAHGHLYLFNWVFGPNKNLAEINFADDIDKYTAALGPYLNAENPDLAAFAKRGGKMIMLSGSADSCVPYHATLDYYERLAERCGGIEQARSFVRFYLVPGMSHGPGPGINSLPSSLDLVVNWREKGVVPDMIQGRRVINGKVELTLPLYPYPTRTAWDAQGGSFKPVEGPRGGVERIAERFRPAAAE